MGKILSIIIPSYNMEKYLPYCLDSLLVRNSQDLLEVIVVNDGSKDSTLAIMQNYASSYPKLFRVVDKKNGNYGSCINAALPLATGQYVKVLDADDSFDTTNLDKFLEYLCNADADLVLSDYEIVNDNRTRQRIIHYDLPINGVVSFLDICDNADFVDEIQMHAVTYRRELLLSIGYHQTEGISYTDQQWIFTPMIGVKSVAYFGKTIYRYLIGREGQTMDPKVKMRSMEHARKNSFGLVSDYETYKGKITSPKVTSYLYSRLAWYIKDIYVFHITHYNRVNAAILRDFDQRLKNASTEIYDMIGSKKVSSFHGFAYIDSWRKHDMPIILVKILGRIYQAIIGLRLRKTY